MTTSAILIEVPQGQIWLPKSQIEYDGEPQDFGVNIELPQWLADEKGV